MACFTCHCIRTSIIPGGVSIWACVMRNSLLVARCRCVRGWANDEAIHFLIHLHKIDIVNHQKHRLCYFFICFEWEKRRKIKWITSTIVLSRPWDHSLLNDCNRIAWRMITNWFLQNVFIKYHQHTSLVGNGRRNSRKEAFDVPEELLGFNDSNHFLRT